ncbi:MAG TPA: DedA family protein [Gemmatimonadales bacterium]|nr:DedA family protein [Gemmatimonadales bacterium]
MPGLLDSTRHRPGAAIGVGIQQLLIDHGIAAIVLGAAIEGDFTMVLAGVVAHLGYFPFPVAVGAAAVGSFLGDCCWYALGRSHTGRFRSGQFYRKVGPKIEQVARRVGVWQLVAARFVYGTKVASMYFWGLHGLRFARFALVDAVGCTLGAGAFVGLGYLIGNGAEVVVGRVKRLEVAVIGALVIAALVLVAIKIAARRRAGSDSATP